jgi:hypothetical protein
VAFPLSSRFLFNCPNPIHSSRKFLGLRNNPVCDLILLRPTNFSDRIKWLVVVVDYGGERERELLIQLEKIEFHRETSNGHIHLDQVNLAPKKRNFLS